MKSQPNKEVNLPGFPGQLEAPAGKLPLSSSLLSSLSEDDVSSDDAMVTLSFPTAGYGDDVNVSCSSLPRLACLENSTP